MIQTTANLIDNSTVLTVFFSAVIEKNFATSQQQLITLSQEAIFL